MSLDRWSSDMRFNQVNRTRRFGLSTWPASMRRAAHLVGALQERNSVHLFVCWFGELWSIGFRTPLSTGEIASPAEARIIGSSPLPHPGGLSCA